MKTIIQCLLMAILGSLSLHAQNEIDLLSNWDYPLRTGANEQFNKIIMASNGQLIAVGETTSEPNNSDGLMAIINPEDGDIITWRNYGGEGNQAFNSIIQNHDGTFTMVGYTTSGPKASKDGWIVQVDIEGNVIFQTEATGNPDLEEEIIDLAINEEGITMAVGLYYDKKVSYNWILQFKDDEILTNQKVDDSDLGEVKAIIAGPENTFVILGNTTEGNRNHQDDIWLWRLDKDGREFWGGPQFYGDKGFQQGSDVVYTPNEGGYAILGTTSSNTAGKTDMWLLKIDDFGKASWSKTYGGQGDEIGNKLIALSEGGFAILGQTWSHLAKAEQSTMRLLLTDEGGKQIDAKNYFIYHGDGDEVGRGLVEFADGTNLAIAGNSRMRNADHFPAGSLQAITYKRRPIRQPNQLQDGTGFGDNPDSPQNPFNVKVTEATFADQNGDQLLQMGERGYFKVVLTNEGASTLTDVIGTVFTPDHLPQIEFWDELVIGTLRPGASKTFYVPVKAIDQIPEGFAELNVEIRTEEVFAASAPLKIGSNEPKDPAYVIVDNHTFLPEANPQPGDLIRLTVQLVNTGGLPSPAGRAVFSVPPGVEAISSKNVSLPPIRGQQTFPLTFSFTYQNNFRGREIPITIQSDDPSLASLYQKFSIPVTPSGSPATANVSRGSGTEVYWVNPKGDGEVNRNEVSLEAMTLSQGQMNKQQVGIFINGQKVQGQKMDEAKLGPPTPSSNERVQQFYENKIKLKPGVNLLKIVVYDEFGVPTGESKSISIHYTPPDKPNLYVYSIGVEHSDLQFTTKDASDFANQYAKLKRDKRLFNKVDIRIAVNSAETTGFNIKAGFLDLENNRKIKESDLVVVFISSHGMVNKQDEFLLLGSDYNDKYEGLTTINFKEDILKKLRSIDGKKLVFIDACHSGAADSRSYSDDATSKFMSDLINNTSGMEIFASCSPDEYSYEDGSWNNGAFTKAILEALSNQPVDMNGELIQADIFAENPKTGQKESGSDGVITIEELKWFVQQRVPYLVRTVKNKNQNPVNKSTQLLPEDMGVFVVEN